MNLEECVACWSGRGRRLMRSRESDDVRLSKRVRTTEPAPENAAPPQLGSGITPREIVVAVGTGLDLGRTPLYQSLER